MKFASIGASFAALGLSYPLTAADEPRDFLEREPEGIWQADRPIWEVERCLMLGGVIVPPYRAPENPDEAFVFYKSPTANFRVVAVLKYENGTTTISAYEGGGYMGAKTFKVCYDRSLKE